MDILSFLCVCCAFLVVLRFGLPVHIVLYNYRTTGDRVHVEASLLRLMNSVKPVCFKQCLQASKSCAIVKISMEYFLMVHMSLIFSIEAEKNHSFLLNVRLVLSLYRSDKICLSLCIVTAQC